jgi:uncharacterized Zn finger protein (UPF0148 family)
MSVAVAADGRIATYAHRCPTCGLGWVSTRDSERRCIFCGGEGVASSAERKMPRAIRTDAPKREPSRPRQHDATRAEVRRGSRKPGELSQGQRAFRERVDRLGR